MSRANTGTQSVRIEGAGQSVDYVEHYCSAQVKNLQLRIRVHVDSYAQQSFGIVEMMTAAGWREVATIRGEALKTDSHVTLQKSLKIPASFAADRDRLLELAIEVL